MKLRKALVAVILVLGVTAALSWLFDKLRWTVKLFGSGGNGQPLPPKYPPMLGPRKEIQLPPQSDPDLEQPAQTSGITTRVHLTFSQMAAVMPEAVGPILKAIGAGKVGQMLSYAGHGSAYAESGIRQVSKATPTLWTRIRAGLVGAKGIIQGITPDAKTGEEGGGDPRKATGASEVPGLGWLNMALATLGTWRDVCNGARCTVAFDVCCDKARAPEFLLKSGILEQMKQLEAMYELGKAASQKFNQLTPIVQVLDTKA